MRKFRECESRDQISLFPRSLEEYVNEEDSVRYIDTLVNEFDLSTIESKYSYNGRPAYSPKVLVKLLVYGKIRGMSSSRELAIACKENVRFMYLVQNEQPDFRTISMFRKEHLSELGELLKQTVRVGIDSGIIKLEHVSVDGSKIRANASAKSFRDKEKLEELLEKLELSLSKDVEAEFEDDGDDDGEPKLPKSLRGKEALKKRLKEALERDKERVSSTDVDANFMKSKDGKHPCYNGQVAVDADSHMVVGATVSTVGADSSELRGMLEEIEATTGKNPKGVSADAGYRDTEGLVELEKRNIDGAVAIQGVNHKYFKLEDFNYDDKNDVYVCPAGQELEFSHSKQTGEEVYISEDCSGCSFSSSCIKKEGTNRSLKIHPNIATVQRMKERMEREDAKEMMKTRAQTVEIVFAWLKSHKKLRQFIYRGLNNVKNQWNFELAVVNIHRLVNIRMLEGVKVA